MRSSSGWVKTSDAKAPPAWSVASTTTRWILFGAGGHDRDLRARSRPQTLPRRRRRRGGSTPQPVPRVHHDAHRVDPRCHGSVEVVAGDATSTVMPWRRIHAASASNSSNLAG